VLVEPSTVMVAPVLLLLYDHLSTALQGLAGVSTHVHVLESYCRLQTHLHFPQTLIRTHLHLNT